MPLDELERDLVELDELFGRAVVRTTRFVTLGVGREVARVVGLTVGAEAGFTVVGGRSGPSAWPDDDVCPCADGARIKAANTAPEMN